MRMVLFEDEHIGRLDPVALGKPAFAIHCGGYRLIELAALGGLSLTAAVRPHLRAIVDEITDKLREDFDLRPKAVDGTLQAAWIVLDYFDVIVHVMRKDVRERYDLETLWGDAPKVKPKKAVRKAS